MPATASRRPRHLGFQRRRGASPHHEPDPAPFGRHRPALRPRCRDLAQQRQPPGPATGTADASGRERPAAAGPPLARCSLIRCSAMRSCPEQIPLCLSAETPTACSPTASARRNGSCSTPRACNAADEVATTRPSSVSAGRCRLHRAFVRIENAEKERPGGIGAEATTIPSRIGVPVRMLCLPAPGNDTQGASARHRARTREPDERVGGILNAARGRPTSTCGRSPRTDGACRPRCGSGDVDVEVADQMGLALALVRLAAFHLP